MWARSDSGNKIVISRRMANEATKIPAHKIPDLGQVETLILMILRDQPNGLVVPSYILDQIKDVLKIEITLNKTELTLQSLKKRGFAEHGNLDTYGAEVQWFLGETGVTYLDERGKY